VPQAQFLGLKVPDPALAWNDETKHWDIGPLDWDEFWRVVKGEGPCNRQRLNARRAAHDDGAWVREAAEAFAAKRTARRAAAAAAE
jgi:ring-1,2-phenylacetyl-CoA epoxidase subunit PaaA